MFDEEIEKTVLYAIIFEGKDYEIEQDDFINARHIKIANAINQLKTDQKTISITAIANNIHANSKQVLEYISSLGECAYGYNADENYNKLIQMSKKRKLYRLAQRILVDVNDKENIDIYINDVLRDIDNINSRCEEEEETFFMQLQETLEDIENVYNNRDDKSLYTSIHPLDNCMYGLHKQEFTIIGARPGVGKTTLALQIAENIASKNQNVIFFSLEMSSLQLIKKILSKKSNVNSYRLRLGTLEDKDFEKIIEATNSICKLPLVINTKVRCIQEIETVCRKLKKDNKLNLIIIDYIQLLRSANKFNNREQEVADISRRLKLLSIELNIPIIALCQLNRNASKSEPTLADLRESGSLEQDADNIIFLYCEDENEKIITMKVAKQRAGETAKFKLFFDKSIGNFRETT